MRKRPITALLAALALLAVTCTASFAQSPTPTATTAQNDGTGAYPPADASKEVKAVYSDYRDGGVIDVCKHTRDVLQETLDGIPAAVDRDFPDFREAVKAGIQKHDKGKCDAAATATPTATATASATAVPTETASPDDGSLPPQESSTPDSGALPPSTDGGSGSSTPPPDDGTLPPAETTTPAPTPTPTPTPPESAITPAPSPTPSVVTRSSTGALLVPGILVGIALLGGLALALAAITGRSPRTRHAFNEAAYRARGTWADFSDWLKFGR